MNVRKLKLCRSVRTLDRDVRSISQGWDDAVVAENHHSRLIRHSEAFGRIFVFVTLPPDAMSAEKDEIDDVGDEDSMIDDAKEDVSDEDSIDSDEEDSMINDAEEDISDEDSIDDVEDLLGYLSEGEDEEMQDFGEREEDSTIVCVYPLFMDISFMRKFSRSLPLGIMRVASTMSQSPFRSIHLPLKIGLNFIKSLLKILNFWCSQKVYPQDLVSFQMSGGMTDTHQ